MATGDDSQFDEVGLEPDDDEPATLPELTRRVEALESKIEGFEDDLRQSIFAIPVILVLLSVAYWAC